MRKEMISLLLQSLDGELNAQESANLQAALSESEDLRQEQAALLRARELVASLHTGSDADFANRVMQKLHLRHERGFLADVVSLSPRVAAACIIFITIALLGIYFYEGKNGLRGDAFVTGVEELAPDVLPEDTYTTLRTDPKKQREKELRDPPKSSRLE